MKAVSALISRYNVILVNQKGGEKMKDKIIKIEIKNGLLMIAENHFSKSEQSGNSTLTMSESDASFGLKEIGIVIEVLLKEQQKAINRQKDEANKLKFSIGKDTPSTVLAGVTNIDFDVEKSNSIEQFPEKGCRMSIGKYCAGEDKGKYFLEFADSEKGFARLDLDWMTREAWNEWQQKHNKD